MKRTRSQCRPWMALLACGILGAFATGCQTNVGGQTLPSAYYLRDDVQYFPAGDEFIIPNQVRALEQYRLEQDAIRDGLDDEEAP